MFKTTGISRFGFGILAIGACLGFQICCLGFEGELCFKFQPGDKFSLVSVTEQKTSRYVSAFGETSPRGGDANEESMEQTSRLECDFDVEEVDQDGCAWAKYTYKRVALRARGAGVDMDYDSDANRPKVPPQVLPLHLARGESFFVKITPQGRIDKINGLSAVVGNAKSKIPNFAGRGQLIQLVERYFDEAAIKRGLESQFAVFPDAPAVLLRKSEAAGGPIDIGGTWNRRQWADEDKISSAWTYQLKENRDGIAVVDVNVVVGSDANEAPIFMEGVKSKREISGLGTGQIEIDESNGRIIKSTLTQDMVEKIEFLPDGAIRRPPPAPPPVRTHIVTTFQMIKRDSEKSLASPASPDASRGGPEPNRP